MVRRSHLALLSSLAGLVVLAVFNAGSSLIREQASASQRLLEGFQQPLASSSTEARLEGVERSGRFREERLAAAESSIRVLKRQMNDLIITTKSLRSSDPEASLPPSSRAFQILVYGCNQDERHVQHAIFAAQAYAAELRRLGRAATVRDFVLENLADSSHIELGDVTFMAVGTSKLAPKCLKEFPALAELLAQRRRHNIVTIAAAGEVFAQGPSCGIGKIDLVMDRSGVPRASGDCIPIHFLQGLMFVARNVQSYNDGLLSFCDDAVRDNIPNKSPDNLVMLATGRVIKRGYHDADALVRGSLFKLATERFGKDVVQGTHFVRHLREQGLDFTEIKCGGNDLEVALCKSKFKFTIDMENTALKGYISEKIFTGLMSRTIPVYFGAPDVANYLNPKRFIRCVIPPEALEELRTKKKNRNFYFTSNPNPSDAEIITAAANLLFPHLQPCLDRMDEVNRDDALYQSMLREPVFADQELACSQAPFINIDVGSQVYAALHDNIGLASPL